MIPTVSAALNTLGLCGTLGIVFLLFFNHSFLSSLPVYRTDRCGNVIVTPVLHTHTTLWLLIHPQSPLPASLIFCLSLQSVHPPQTPPIPHFAPLGDFPAHLPCSVPRPQSLDYTNELINETLIP